jgi:hypothetical protein
MEVSGQLHPLYPQGKSPWYPLDRRLGGPQSRCTIQLITPYEVGPCHHGMGHPHLMDGGDGLRYGGVAVNILQ